MSNSIKKNIISRFKIEVVSDILLLLYFFNCGSKIKNNDIIDSLFLCPKKILFILTERHRCMFTSNRKEAIVNAMEILR